MVSNSSRGLYGRLVEQLGSEIVSGKREPGERLDVEGLEHQHGVSRTVVREAMRVLGTKGLIDARPKRGTFVLERDHWNMLDPEVIGWRYSGRPDEEFLASLDEVRRIIEPAGARLAAIRRTDDDVARLRDALGEMTDTVDDLDASVSADLRFHRTLMAAAHNEMLQHLEIILINGLRVRDELVMDAQLESDLPGHGAVIEAVVDGDPDAAEAAMLALLERSAKHAGEAMSKRRRR